MLLRQECKALAGTSLLSGLHLSLWGYYTEQREFNLHCLLNKSTLKDVNSVVAIHQGKPLNQLAGEALITA